ncbi:MAG: uroporphyrinogen-III synthase [Pyrinomonadaceae bacterium]
MKRPVVLVLRGDNAFSAKLREHGCDVIILALIEVRPVEDHGEIDGRLSQISDLDGLFFTSPYAAEMFFARLKAGGVVLNTNIYVLGERTKKVFDNVGIGVRFKSDANTAAEMITAFGDAEFAGKRLLFVRGDKSSRSIPVMLAGKASIDELIVYRTIESLPDAAVVDETIGRLEQGEIDWLCFFSPTGVEAYGKLFGFQPRPTVKTAVIGETTAAAAKQAGLNVELISQRANAEYFAAQLIEHIRHID